MVKVPRNYHVVKSPGGGGGGGGIGWLMVLLGMAVHRHELECRAETLGCYFQGEGQNSE